MANLFNKPSTSRSTWPRLERWVVSGNFLYGFIYNDHRFVDGTFVCTPVIQEIDFIEGIAITRNTIYSLGNPLSESFNENKPDSL